MKIATRHDPTHRGLFECPTMFLSLLRSGVGTFRLPKEWLDLIVPGSMTVERTESNTRAHGQRRSDLVVSFRLRAPKGKRGDRMRRSHRPARLTFHVEFQSEPDPHIHWRFDEYIHGVRSQVVLSKRDSRSVLISALVYTGKRTWNPHAHTVPPGYPFCAEEVARVTGTVVSHYMVDIHRCRIEDLSEDEILTWWIRLEQAKTSEEVEDALNGAGRLLKPESEDGERLLGLLLDRAHDLLGESAEELDVPRLLRNWKRGDKNMGTAAQTILGREWARRDAKAYREERTRQRQRLRRLVKLRFGPDTSKRLSALIKRTNDADWLDQIADWFAISKSSEEFLARVEGGHSPNGAPALDAAD